jgi:hypothetical protein
MARPASSRSSLVLAVVFALAVACRPPVPAAPTLDPNADVVVPYPVAGGGVVRFTVRPRYDVGQPVTILIDVVAGEASIRGPLSGRIFASGLEGERVVRLFAAGSLATIEVAPNSSGHTTIVWDGRADDGEQVPRDTYSIAFDFLIGDESARFGTVIQVVRP